MVLNIIGDEATHYKCEECGFIYKDEQWAEKCEKWCQKNHSCNLDIIKHGVAPPAN